MTASLTYVNGKAMVAMMTTTTASGNDDKDDDNRDYNTIISKSCTVVVWYFQAVK
jgi:hypothetical protein